ncbi:hypothetical protein F4808DRAFT_465247 [Astrocystis sublimbata]|nr:hypothetical protein F4808DRAFT_465247 [Astrocystis sublimbata]
MKFFASLIISFSLAAGALAAPSGCENQADPDNGIGNYCYCSSDGNCYFNNPNTGCNPPGGAIGYCP